MYGFVEVVAFVFPGHAFGQIDGVSCCCDFAALDFLVDDLLGFLNVHQDADDVFTLLLECEAACRFQDLCAVLRPCNLCHERFEALLCCVLRKNLDRAFGVFFGEGAKNSVYVVQVACFCNAEAFRERFDFVFLLRPVDFCSFDKFGDTERVRASNCV